MQKIQKMHTPWTMPVAVEDVPDTGLHVEIAAPATVRREVAALAGLRDLPELSASFDLTRQDKGLHVVGQVCATIGQTCVVTLEPVENRVEEAVDLRFAPSPAAAGGDDAGEPPELLVDGAVDLAAIAVEFLLLGIDPYPRKPGAAFAAPRPDTSGENPFAALAPLKKSLSGGKP